MKPKTKRFIIGGLAVLALIIFIVAIVKSNTSDAPVKQPVSVAGTKDKLATPKTATTPRAEAPQSRPATSPSTAATIPKTGPGDVIMLFAVVSFVAAAGHYAWFRLRAPR